MSGRGETERNGQQRDARTPLPPRPQHGMGDPDGRVDQPVESPRREQVVVGLDRHAHDGGAKAVEAERQERALIAEEPARDPPQTRAQP